MLGRNFHYGEIVEARGEHFITRLVQQSPWQP